MKLTRTKLVFLLAIFSIIIDAVMIGVTWNTSFWEGMYCSLGIASTVGCDAAAQDAWGKIVVDFAVLTSLPLVAAVFGMVQGAHIHRRVNKSLQDQFDKHHEKMSNLINGVNNVEDSTER